jgi:hypothetical protein
MAATNRCKAAIAAIRERKKRAAWWKDFTLSRERASASVRLQRDIENRFNAWWDTWIEPELQEAEKG